MEIKSYLVRLSADCPKQLHACQKATDGCGEECQRLFWPRANLSLICFECVEQKCHVCFPF